MTSESGRDLTISHRRSVAQPREVSIVRIRWGRTRYTPAQADLARSVPLASFRETTSSAPRELLWRDKEGPY
jgi:hypothetical protein